MARNSIESLINQFYQQTAESKKAVILAPINDSPDDDPAQTLGGNGLIISISPKAATLLEKLGKSLPLNTSLNLHLTDDCKNVSAHIMNAANLDQADAIGYGDQQVEMAKKLGETEKCEEEAVKLSRYKETPNLFIQVGNNTISFGASLDLSLSSYATYEAYSVMEFTTLNYLMDKAFDHQMTENELYDDKIFERVSNNNAQRP